MNFNCMRSEQLDLAPVVGVSYGTRSNSYDTPHIARLEK
jgi:hypothetical protein